MPMPDTVVICGGGTGGHIFPGLAVAEELAKIDMPARWLGLHGGREQTWVPARGIDFRAVRLAKPAGVAGMAAALAGLREAVRDAKAVLRDLGAACVLGLGGYPSLPGALAAVSLRLPLLILEQNRRAGLANRLLSVFARRKLASFKGTFRFGNVRVTGTPLRAEFAGIAPPRERRAGRKEALRILVLGGSAGAAALNAGLPVILGEYGAQRKISVVHQAGAGRAAGVAEDYARKGVQAEAVDFLDDIWNRMSAADLVISRAGGATVAELCAVGVGAVLVPYMHARGHQSANAAVLERAGAALVVREPQMLGGEAMMRALHSAESRLSLVKMAVAARSLARPEAAADVARACLEARDET